MRNDEWLRRQCDHYTLGLCKRTECLVRAGKSVTSVEFDKSTCPAHELLVELAELRGKAMGTVALAVVAPKGAVTALRIWDIKSIIEAKEGLAADLRNKHCAEVALGTHWDSPIAKEQYVQLKREVKGLRIKLATMA